MERISLCTEFIQRPAVGDVGLEARALALSIFAEGDPHTVAMESWLGGGRVQCLEDSAGSGRALSQTRFCTVGPFTLKPEIHVSAARVER